MLLQSYDACNLGAVTTDVKTVRTAIRLTMITSFGVPLAASVSRTGSRWAQATERPADCLLHSDSNSARRSASVLGGAGDFGAASSGPAPAGAAAASASSAEVSAAAAGPFASVSAAAAGSLDAPASGERASALLAMLTKCAE